MTRFVFLVFFVLALLGSVGLAQERRVALVIGNGAYADAAKLPNPANDAKAMADALQRLGFDVRLVMDATQADLLSAIDDYAKLLPGSSASMLFYAGHGIQLEGQNFLLPVDIKVQNERSIRYGAVDVSEVVAEMERSSPVNLIILDACRNNPFVEELKRGLKSRSVNIAQGLAPIKAQSSGTIIAFAAAAGSVAADGEGEHSPYTEALLAEIEKPGVEVALALRRVAGRVIEKTKGEQRPELLVRLVNEFYMKEAEPVPVSAVAEVVPPKLPEVVLPTVPEVVAKVEERPAKPRDTETIVAIADGADDPRFVTQRAQWGRVQPRAAVVSDWHPAPLANTVEDGDHDTASTASWVKLDSQVQMAIGAKGDNDWLRFEVGTPGILHLVAKQVPAEIDLSAQLHDRNLQAMGNGQTAPRPGGDLDVTIDVPRAGTYSLLVADSYNDGWSATTFPLSLTFQPVDDGYETNNSIGNAWPLDMNGEVQGHIFPLADADWFQFWAEQPGRFTVSATDIPADIDAAFRLYNGDGQIIYDWTVSPRPGGDAQAVYDLKLPGAYYLEFADSYNDKRSADRYTLKIAFMRSVDSNEPNDSYATARRIPPTGKRRLTVLPKGDADWFRLKVDQAGELRLAATEVPQTLDVSMRVYNSDRAIIADWMVPPRPGGDTIAQVDLPAPGEYYVEIADSYNDQADIAHYTFETAFIPQADQYEPNNALGSATPVSTNSEFLFNILPRGDTDWFAMAIEAAGELAVSIDEGPPDLDLTFRVWNADRQIVQDWISAYAKGGLTAGAADLSKPGLYFIEVADAFNDQRSVLPATLQSHLTPAASAYEPNNSYGDAVGLPVDTQWQDSIFPKADADFYLLDVPAAGEIAVTLGDVPKSLDLYFRLYDANNVASAWYGPASPGDDFTQQVPMPSGGQYRIEIADGYNDARSPLPYRFGWTFTARP